MQKIDFINISFFLTFVDENQVRVIADAVKHHLRLAKIKFSTHVSVSKDCFHESAPINEQFYGSIMKVLDNGLVRVKWEVDTAQSLVALNDF